MKPSLTISVMGGDWRPWMALAVLALLVPLFAGLGRTDYEEDEAIYSYAVDGILANGDWMNPLSSPHDHAVFLEKPPLKFWMVAAPIALGLLPHNEFGMRFWDALLGAIALLYVFAIGRRLSGAIGGFVAVLALLVYEPLLFVNGLRKNNMQAPLVLAYCGGVYHYIAWVTGSTRRRAHVFAVALYVFLGFMTKFVAVAFLPVVLLVSTVLVAEARRRAIEDWRAWIAAAAVAVALASPWFVYQHVTVGREFWDVILGAHVYARFTTALDPAHVHPWNYYLVEIVAELRRNGTAWLVAAGLVILIVRALRDRGVGEVVVLVWAALPIALMSFGSSKLHHYAYPFVPPLALAAGICAGWILGAVPHLADLATARIGFRPGAVVRVLLYSFAFAAVIVAALTIVTGPLRVQTSGGLTLFRNSDPYRPLAIACLCAIVMWPGAKRVLKLALLIMIVAEPLGAYHDVTGHAVAEHHPLRDLRDCLTATRTRLQESGVAAAGPYVAHADKAMFHSYFYYLRQVGDLGRDIERNDQAIVGSLFEKGRERPVLILESDYRATVAAHPDRAFTLVPLVPQPHGLLILLPGPYAGCVPDRSTSPGLRTARVFGR
jgi:4-amino-4-deoxy-L-arabinose transferase-like glycosyltransferase